MKEDYGVCILGAGISGLSSAQILMERGVDVVVVEQNGKVGGLAKTYSAGEFKFDLGGHRFFSNNKVISEYFKKITGDELIWVNRKSRIYYNSKYFSYPLKLTDVITKINPYQGLKIMIGYVFAIFNYQIRKKEIGNVEEWLVSRFGRELYKIFFKNYTEKVWGIPCQDISKDWAAQRIKEMSVFEAIKNIFIKTKNKPVSLIDSFMYCNFGIGEFSYQLVEKIGKENIKVNSEVKEIKVRGGRVESVVVGNKDNREEIKVEHVLSSIPLTRLIELISPKVPEDILRAAKQLRYRSIVVVAVFIDQEIAIEDTWLYIQDRRVKMTRIHAPQNWSKNLVPKGKTSLIIEYPCFYRDELWNMSDTQLGELAIEELKLLDILNIKNILSTTVTRERYAYPIYHMGYRDNRKRILDYIQKNIGNLEMIGRTGRFQYYNMDHCIETGIKAALNLTGHHYDIEKINKKERYLEKGWEVDEKCKK